MFQDLEIINLRVDEILRIRANRIEKLRGF